MWLDYQLVILPWSGWTYVASGDAAVLIPATFVCERGFWFPSTGGLRGVIRARVVYLLFQPATHYYATMTRSKRMPVFAGDTI